MDRWWQRDVIGADKLPLMVCFLAFVLTFLITRTVTRSIRAGRGPFRDQVTSGGVHIHHAIPGLVLLIVGAFVAVGAPGSGPWPIVAAVLVGVGVSLVLDEFALLLHLDDVYWSNEGRISVDMVSLTAACLGLVLVGISPIGVDQVGGSELAVRLTGTAFVLLHFTLVLTCVLKGASTGWPCSGLLPAPVALVGAVRLARPRSTWARRRYDDRKTARAAARNGRLSTDVSARPSGTRRMRSAAHPADRARRPPDPSERLDDV